MVCYVHYNTYSLEGTCKSTTDSVLARHLGTYDASLYYGPTFFVIGTGQTSVGLEELFKRMKKGGYAKAIIPPWLTAIFYFLFWYNFLFTREFCECDI
jgi:FKBP-type peptidyl-prolyl cis-trans isomerase 2